MHKVTRKFISLFFLITFLLASGPGQIIHAALHHHSYPAEFNTGVTSINTPHTLCPALQLMLPEFFQSGSSSIQKIIIAQIRFFAAPGPAIPHVYSFKNSGRAPPVLA